MPNYVKNIIKMDGIASLPLYSECSGDEKDFDFNKLIPMPESLNMESGSRTSESVLYYLTDRLTLSLSALDEERHCLVQTVIYNMFNQDWPQTLYERLQSRVQEMPQEELDEMYQLGIRYVENYRQYGALTWYEWCIREWGTKWNACESEIIDDDTLTFETAWDNPEPIILKLGEMYPGTKIEHWWADEDLGANTGYHCIEGNTIVTKTPDNGSEEALEICQFCWGYGPDEYDE